jgi:predicted glycogen debranching enzyme
MTLASDNQTEWLEADGLGGFASGTTSGERSRRYHALLLSATRPPSGRMVLVNGFDAWVDSPAGRFPISTQRYSPDVVYPHGFKQIVDFKIDPWPTWHFRLADGITLMQELFVPHAISACCLRWRLNSETLSLGGRGQGEGESPTAASDFKYTLELRPFLSGRDYHATHHENAAFRFAAQIRDAWLDWKPYHDVPSVCALTNGEYRHDPEWFRNFLYTIEKERGLDFLEDLASPGVLKFDLSKPAVLIFATEGCTDAVRKLANPNSANTVDAADIFERLAASESSRRTKFKTPLHGSADAYLVRRNDGQTIIAGYPWFTDWGRDTFISLRGLCLAIDKLEEAKQILLAWSGAVSEGMLPNRFPDAGDTPEYNSVDASLWYIIAVHDLLDAASRQKQPITGAERQKLEAAILAIVDGYSRGTRFGIRVSSDGLLAAGQPGWQLTWMDAKVGDHVITPRIGKPVEIQALWLNALWIAGRIDPRWTATFEKGRAEFERRFWNAKLNCLFDVVDVDHKPGTADESLRPNQILAVGGLPLALLDGQRARSVVDVVESRLLAPLGLRTLAPGSPNYAPQCTGGPEQRDAAYHQGTIWPWLMGPFVEAWLRVRGDTAEAKRQAAEGFLPPLEQHLNATGLGHISEIIDAESPFTPRGCPFQAWSQGEFLRLKFDVLAG